MSTYLSACFPLPSPFTADHFAGALSEMRPSLLYWLSLRNISTDDAQDLISEAVSTALLILPEFRPETGVNGLFRWMGGILRCVILTDRQRAARRPKTVPIETAAELPAPPPMVESEPLSDEIEALPDSQRPLILDWLAGYSQVEIARRHGIHRNTAGNRIELAFQSLRVACPDVDDLHYSSNLIDYCSRAATYRRPVGVWRSWMHRHPRDVRFVDRSRISELRRAA